MCLVICFCSGVVVRGAVCSKSTRPLELVTCEAIFVCMALSEEGQTFKLVTTEGRERT